MQCSANLSSHLEFDSVGLSPNAILNILVNANGYKVLHELQLARVMLMPLL